MYANRKRWRERVPNVLTGSISKWWLQMICTSASCSWNLPKARALLSKSENNYSETERGVLTSSYKSGEHTTDLVDCFQIMSRGTYKQNSECKKDKTAHFTHQPGPFIWFWLLNLKRHSWNAKCETGKKPKKESGCDLAQHLLRWTHKTTRWWSLTKYGAQMTWETFLLFSTFKKLLNSRQELSTYTVEMRCSIRYSAAKPSPRRACVRNPSSSALIGDNSDMKLETTGEGRETWFRITRSNKTSERNLGLKKETVKRKHSRSIDEDRLVDVSKRRRSSSYKTACVPFPH